LRIEILLAAMSNGETGPAVRTSAAANKRRPRSSSRKPSQPNGGRVDHATDLLLFAENGNPESIRRTTRKGRFSQ
jgi:hypothetical protein